MNRFFAIILSAAALFASTEIDAQPKERTLAIIKPDATQANNVGNILSRYEKAGFRIDALKVIQLSDKQAKQFYAIHDGKPFFNELIKFMTSGPSVVVVLEGDNAVQRNRDLMGAVDKPGTLRAEFGKSLTYNAVHGSDSQENAKQEIGYFFPSMDVVERF